MNDNALLKLLLIGVGLLILAFASWRILSYGPERTDKPDLFSFSTDHEVRSKRKKQAQQQYVSEVERLKQQEIVENKTAAPEPVGDKTDRADLKKFNHPHAAAAKTAVSPRETPYKSAVAYPRRNTPAATAPAPVTAADAPAFTPSSAARLAGRTDNTPQGQTAESAASYNPNAYDKSIADKRQSMLSAYLKPNREVEEKMNRTLANLASNIENAVAQALMPKSKKAQNIEKYRPKNAAGAAASAGGGAASGPFANVLAQVANQGNGIVENTRQAFGDKAAGDMAALINNFQQELSGAVNAPDATNEQVAAQIRDISKKYQSKINKLSEKQQYDKFVQDRTEQDAQQKQELGQYYKGEVLDALGNILDKARAKDLELATQNLPEKEYWEQLLKNNYDTQVEMRDAVKNAGEPLEYLNKWQDKQKEKAIADRRAAEENGLVESYAVPKTENEIKAEEKTLAKEKADVVAQIAAGYGEDAAREMGTLYEEYAQKMLEISRTPMSAGERAEKQEQVRRLYNQKIADWQKSPQAREMAVTQNTDRVMQNLLTQNPNIANNPQAREQFEAQARPVVEKAMARIVEIQNDDELTPQQKQTAIAKAQHELEQSLRGGMQ